MYQLSEVQSAQDSQGIVRGRTGQALGYFYFVMSEHAVLRERVLRQMTP